LEDILDGKEAPKAVKGSLRSSISGRSALILAIGIIVISYGLFFYLQGIVEREFRDSLFEQQQARQIESTRAVAQHIESDLGAISAKLELVASEQGIRSGDLSGALAKALLEEAFAEIKLPTTNQNTGSQGTNSIIDSLYLVNSDGIITLDVRSGGGSIVGTDISSDPMALSGLRPLSQLSATRESMLEWSYQQWLQILSFNTTAISTISSPSIWQCLI
jgi:hypothetical protein